MAELQEEFWAHLLAYIEARTVIPVIGPELVTVRDGDRDVPLYRWLAQRLAADLQLPTAELPEGFDLNDLMRLLKDDRRNDLYLQIDRMLRNAALTPSESLRALAGIPGFDLFISLTFDSQLAEALGAAQISYSPNAVRDLPSPKAELRRSVVFHLLGRSTVLPNYVVCDDDLLEFVHGLQDKQKQPQNLFDALRENHLLILGCDFGDWLARFFLRTARSLELSKTRKRWDVLVGERIPRDAKLVEFLEGFSHDSRLVPWTSEQFVTELARRWHLEHPAEVRKAEGVIPAGAIFVSYASEDLAAASRLAAILSSAGLDVWFDKNALRLGDDWARSIRLGIKSCSLFLPVISHQAMREQNRRSYFWEEWNEANDFARKMSPDEPFIIPIVIDETRLELAPLPEFFTRKQGKRLQDGNITPGDVELLRKLVQDFHDRQGLK